MMNRESEIQKLARELLLNGYSPDDAFRDAEAFIRMCDGRTKDKPDVAGGFFDSVQVKLPWMVDTLSNRQLVEGYMLGGCTVDETADRIEARAALTDPDRRPTR